MMARRRRYCILGLGLTGQSYLRFMQRQGIDFNEVTVFDPRCTTPALSQVLMSYPGIACSDQPLTASFFQDAEQVFISPGISIHHQALKQAPLTNDIELFAREAQAPIIGITGTNGKTTLTEMVGTVLKSLGLSVQLGGNIGQPVLDLLALPIPDYYVLELSSFQLALAKSLSCCVAVILNLTPDHLDWHLDFEDYKQSKLSIYRHAETVVVNRDDVFTHLPEHLAHTVKRRISFGLNPGFHDDWGILIARGSAESQTQMIARGETAVLDTKQLSLVGRHSWLQVMACLAVCDGLGLSLPQAAQAIIPFENLPHRCQWVRTLDGVSFVNDSKGTNLGACLAAIDSFSSADGLPRMILILGGQAKGVSFKSLKPSILKHVRKVVLIGQDAKQIASDLHPSVPIHHAVCLSKAVLWAKQEAIEGDTVLLSPACASRDQYRDYVARGEDFIKQVKAL